MRDSRINPDTIIGKVNAKALDILEEHPEGVQWKDLNRMIEESDPSFHPKTVNGCVWKLTEKFPDLVHKPAKGLFRLKKYAKK